MKKMKKLLSMLLAVVMVLAMAAPSFADTTDSSKGEIVINNAIAGKTYTLYKIFSLESFSGDNYSYKIAEGWRTFVENDDYKEYFTLDKDGYLIGNKDMDESVSRKFAQDALDWAGKTDTIQKVTDEPTKTEDVFLKDEAGNLTDKVDTEHKKLTFSNLPLGYYLVDSSVGALCSLGTTATVATIIEKNDVPTVDKNIVEKGSDVKENTVSIGDIITYKSVITAKPGAQTYVFHDRMEDGLTFINTDENLLTITWKEKNLTVNVDYKLTPISKTNGDKVDNLQGFDITFTESFMKELNEELNNMTTTPVESKITITYYAQLNENAVIYGDDSNDNTAYLTYGNKTDDNRTPDSTTKTYTFKTSVYKYTNGENGTKTPLAGAEFSLSLSGNVENYAKIYVVKLSTTGDATPVYRVATPEEITAKGDSLSDTITTDATGAFEIQGLEGQVYYLYEEKAPAGYNKLTDPIKIKIYDKDGVIPDSEIEVKRGQTVTDKETTNGTTVVAPGVVDKVEVYNNSGALLPSTGGIGTTIFYAAGIILMAGAVFFVVRRKKA